jgi:hypothetical protein
MEAQMASKNGKEWKYFQVFVDLDVPLWGNSLFLELASPSKMSKKKYTLFCDKVTNIILHCKVLKF